MPSRFTLILSLCALALGNWAYGSPARMAEMSISHESSKGDLQSSSTSYVYNSQHHHHPAVMSFVTYGDNGGPLLFRYAPPIIADSSSHIESIRPAPLAPYYQSTYLMHHGAASLPVVKTDEASEEEPSPDSHQDYPNKSGGGDYEESSAEATNKDESSAESAAGDKERTEYSDFREFAEGDKSKYADESEEGTYIYMRVIYFK